MDLDPVLTFASFAIRILVDLTEMGSGPLMNPVLVPFFAVPPLTGVLPDPRGAVHCGQGTWLSMGEVVNG